jgi:hypothetical protein
MATRDIIVIGGRYPVAEEIEIEARIAAQQWMVRNSSRVSSDSARSRDLRVRIVMVHYGK